MSLNKRENWSEWSLPKNNIVKILAWNNMSIPFDIFVMITVTSYIHITMKKLFTRLISAYEIRLKWLIQQKYNFLNSKL